MKSPMKKAREKEEDIEQSIEWRADELSRQENLDKTALIEVLRDRIEQLEKKVESLKAQINRRPIKWVADTKETYE